MPCPNPSWPRLEVPQAHTCPSASTAKEQTAEAAAETTCNHPIGSRAQECDQSWHPIHLPPSVQSQGTDRRGCRRDDLQLPCRVRARKYINPHIPPTWPPASRAEEQTAEAAAETTCSYPVGSEHGHISTPTSHPPWPHHIQSHGTDRRGCRRDDLHWPHSVSTHVLHCRSCFGLMHTGRRTFLGILTEAGESGSDVTMSVQHNAASCKSTATFVC